MNLLNTHNMISKTKYGFIKKKFTFDATFDVTEFNDELDKGNKRLGVLLHLAKSFDKVKLKWLLYKLKNVGIKQTILQLFVFYLTNKRKGFELDRFYQV